MERHLAGVGVRGEGATGRTSAAGASNTDPKANKKENAKGVAADRPTSDVAPTVNVLAPACQP